MLMLVLMLLHQRGYRLLEASVEQSRSPGEASRGGVSESGRTARLLCGANKKLHALGARGCAGSVGR
eukprot:1813365-Rhodomonas_salina.2